MKIPVSRQDKLRAALGLSLACGLFAPATEVNAKSPPAELLKQENQPAQSKGSKKGSAGKVLKPDGVKAEQKPAKDSGAEPQPSAKAPPAASEPCPACGRG